jgi:hypothetical protein
MILKNFKQYIIMQAFTLLGRVYARYIKPVAFYMNYFYLLCFRHCLWMVPMCAVIQGLPHKATNRMGWSTSPKPHQTRQSLKEALRPSQALKNWITCILTALHDSSKTRIKLTQPTAITSCYVVIGSDSCHPGITWFTITDYILLNIQKAEHRSYVVTSLQRYDTALHCTALSVAATDLCPCRRWHPLCPKLVLTYVNTMARQSVKKKKKKKKLTAIPPSYSPLPHPVLS